MKNLFAIFVIVAGVAAAQAATRPNVDRLAKRGLLFTNAHCVSPSAGCASASAQGVNPGRSAGSPAAAGVAAASARTAPAASKDMIGDMLSSGNIGETDG